MKKRYIFAHLLLLLFFGPASGLHATAVISTPPASGVIITAVQVAKNNEFVEIYNSSEQTVDVTEWQIQYRSAGSQKSSPWESKAAVACVPGSAVGCRVELPSHQRLIFANYEIANLVTQQLSPGNSSGGAFYDSKGQIRLASPVDGDSANFDQQDMIGYGGGNAKVAETTPVGDPGGEVMLRKVDEFGKIIDTNNNAADFQLGCYTPMSQDVPFDKWLAALGGVCQAPANEDEDMVPVTTQPGDGTGQTETPVGDVTNPGQGAVSPTYLPLKISELLPDPASPQVDSSDEFIELYNPNSEAVNTSGYTLETGADFRYHYVLGSQAIAPGGYLAIKSGESHLSLSNSGTTVRLLDPGADVVDLVDSYGLAKTGQGWAFVNGIWQWTTTPTPGQPNVLTLPAAVVPKATATSSVKKTVSIPKTANSKSTKSSTPRAVKAAKTAATQSSPAPAQGGNGGFNLDYALLIPIGAITVGYALYEYRANLARFFRKIRLALTSRNKSEVEPIQQMD